MESTLLKCGGFTQRGTFTSDRPVIPRVHSDHRARWSLRITSSQPRSSLHNFWSSRFAGKIIGAARPSGSYSEDITDKMLLLVFAVTSRMVLKLKVSCSVSHCIPKARSIGSFSKSKLRLFTEGARSDFGTDAKTSRRLLSHFVNRKPPLLNNAGSWSTNFTASSVEATDLRQSST